MPLPLVWLGAGIAALYAGTQLTREHQKSKGIINHFPGDCKKIAVPENGSIVCCGIYEVFQHTGIWCDNNIIELKGNGLVRSISPSRFLKERSGNRIYVACDESLTPLAEEITAQRASERLFEYSEYDVFRNNCHRFTLQCLFGYDTDVTRFATFNEHLSRYFKKKIYWQPFF